MKQTYLVYGQDCLEWMYEKDVAKIAVTGEFSGIDEKFGYLFMVDVRTGLQWQTELQFMSPEYDVFLLTTKQAIANDIWLVG